MHGQEHLAPPRQVLDVAVAAVFWSAGNSSRALLANLLLDACVSPADVHALRIGRESHLTLHVGARLDQLAFATVPLSEDLCRRGTPQDSGMYQASEPYAGNT